MYRKFFTAIIMASLFITGCSKKDLEYYQSNIEDAESKVNECAADMKEAFASQNEEDLKSVMEDPECKNAEIAFRKYKSKRAKLAREEKRKEEERKKAEEEKIFKKEYGEQVVALKAMDFLTFSSLNKECLGQLFKTPTAKCQAYKDLNEDRKANEIKVLMGQYKDGELENFKAKKCSGLEFDALYCELSRVAVSQQQTDIVNNYLEKRDVLKEDFNACYREYQRLKKANKYNEMYAVNRTYKCSLVIKASQRLKIYNFNQPM